MLKNENTPFNIASPQQFSDFALHLFNYQYENNPVYRQWVELLKINPKKVQDLTQIPFLPVEFFKSHKVVCGNPETSFYFSSSSTTSQAPSKHYVSDLGLYEQSFRACFTRFYGPVQDYCILALLPGYLERKDSSLVYMCDKLMGISGHPLNGFYLNQYKELIKTIEQLKQMGQKTLLLGVSYALLDFCEECPTLTDDFIVMETGGMKGTRREMPKEEMQAWLCKKFNLKSIHSEYGMTELLSQAYSKGDGNYVCPPWMKVLVRETEDALELRKDGKSGGLNIIDLANMHSCAFLATKDLGRLNGDGSFQLIGRYDHSDVRGCNLMMENF